MNTLHKRWLTLDGAVDKREGWQRSGVQGVAGQHVFAKRVKSKLGRALSSLLRTTLSKLTVLATSAVYAAIASAAFAETSVLTLTLDRGVEDGTAMVLDLSLQDGRFDKDLWGTAYEYNLAQHTGTVQASECEGDTFRISVRLPLEGDPVAPAGLATYDISVTRKADAWSGTYTGAFNDATVTGAVAGRVSAPAVRDLAGVGPLQPAEHPRLIFRKRDMPEIRRRMDTPEGKAILSMLNERSPLREVAQVDDRRDSWMAANLGVLYQLTEDTNFVRQAREVLMDEVIAKPMPWDRLDIHHATRLLGIALTYDLCYEAWDDAFRRLLGEFIRVAASELSRGVYHGFNMNDKEWSPAPWGHRNAIRMSCAGVAAMAILGDPDTAGKPLPDTARILRVADRHVEQYLRLGVTRAGTGVEGILQGGVPARNLALANGVLHFLHASGVARGRDFSAVNPLLVAGSILGTRPGSNSFDFALSSISVTASGLWPIGLGTVPPEFLPAMKWCFDRDAGLLGKQHFGCAYPYQAAYALKNYPFGVESKAPGDVLPLFAADPVNGHFLLRNRWQDADDATAEMYLNSRGMPPARTKDMDLQAGMVNVSAFGATLLRGFMGTSRINDKAAAAVLYSENSAGQAFIGMDLSDVYRPAVAKSKPRGGMTRDFKPIVKRQWQRDAIQEFLKNAPAPKVRPDGSHGQAGTDAGPQVVRHMAVDMSGECGAPVLVAIAERSSGDVAGPWRMPVQGRVVSPGVGQFVAGDANGANMSGRFVVPSDAKVSGTGQVAGKGEYFVVFTVQGGAAPALAVEGAGFDAKVRIGGRTVSFDGRRIVLGK